MDPSSSTQQRQFIDNDNIELVEVIGTGAYGVVFLAIDRHPSLPQPVYRAVKCLRRNGLDARQKHFQRREIALHRLASSHPSIITMDRIVEDGDQIYLIMDFGEEGDLFAMITDKQRYVGDDELIRSVFLQLLDGVAFLHGLGIAHRDVKPENIVCSDDGTRARLCDFGLATSESVSSEFGCGSTFYIAPECLGDWSGAPSYPTRSGDIWSLGIILVNLVCGRNPWRIASPTDESFDAYLKDINFLRRILPISQECLYILSHIFTVDPAQRIDLVTLRQMIMEIRSFSMDEEELRRVHLAAQATQAEEELFAFDEEYQTQNGTDGQTPSLRADSGSPSPSSEPSSYRYQRSRSASSNGPSLPPTPLLGEVPSALSSTDLSELFNSKSHRDMTELRINPTTPDVISSTQPNPFFR